MTGGTNIHDGGSGRYVGGETPTRDDHLATKGYVDAHSGSISVTDGTHTVNPATELDFTSGATVTDAGGGVAQVAVAGGGSQPHTQEVFNAPNTTVANATQAALPWGTGSGDSLLDVAAPTLPTIITTGIYSFSLTIQGLDFTAGGYFIGTFEIDPDNVDVYMRCVSNPAGADGPSTPLTAVWYVTAGMAVKVQVINRDGAESRDFNFACYVQRLG